MLEVAEEEPHYPLAFVGAEPSNSNYMVLEMACGRGSARTKPWDIGLWKAVKQSSTSVCGNEGTLEEVHALKVRMETGNRT